eukprot:TRINITY_DN6438_c0_g1_i3.p1 TRINITY_DN6438_c0_g1~~TRINITY_DN6438_c0_g1_i3.p1  ORF type:complete len:503 (-),score=97.25 TRINITY_DN6438_c0_g1_i3:81-1541(-)
MDESPMDLTVEELITAVQARKITPIQSIEASLARIKRLNPIVNAFTFVCETEARRKAKEQTERLERGETVGPLAGVPIGVKDLEDVKGLPTSFGCKVFVNSKPAKKSSPQVERLEAQGCIVVGKTNVPAFGSAAYTKNLAFGTTRNAWNLSRTSGGSSGGSATAVAARMVPMATGSDAGGSIRIPATFCGCFGIKPTFGMIPQTELQGFGVNSWVDSIHYGPLTRSVYDAALYMDITTGYHPLDPKSYPRIHSSYSKKLKEQPLEKKLKIGFTTDFGFTRKIQVDILAQVKKSVEGFKKLGHQVEEFRCELPDVGLDWALLHASQSYISVYPLIKDHEDKVERSLVGGLRSMQDLTLDGMGDAMKNVFKLHKAVNEKLFEKYDVVITPAMPIDAFEANGPIPSTVDGEEIEGGPLTQLGFLFPFNFTGHPACVVRCSQLTNAGLPCAFQIVANKFQDDLLLQIAHQYEQEAKPYATWPDIKQVSRI